MEKTVKNPRRKIFLKKKELEEILLKHGLKKGQLCQQMEIGRAHLSYLLTHRLGVSPKKLEKILSLFPECLFDDLFEISNGKENE